MQREELIELVPIRSREGRPHRVALRDIPEPWRTQFAAALRGSACPIDDALGPCAFAWDWMGWVKGDWRGYKLVRKPGAMRG